MAKKRPALRLTSGEVDLMDLLWRHGPMTLQQAHRAFESDFPSKSVGYTTMQTRLNRLADKGFASRSPDRPAVYAAAIDRSDVQADHLDDVLKRLSGGSVVPLVAHLVQDRQIAPEELAELKRLVRQAEKDLKNASRNEEAE
ncbi:BlaI/MecI/CopY family transcriptional regulator [Stieleria varia]|uniref:Penicillinase repressor n=1 Tax=Stieleria varia TaxID=2528005 RepID=A0A5C6AG80_9BACT|nr:BlaI/MecI/CopY family transcriptional regulator [Stieleria varia]TWT98470.1 Penicillinase repressor [Stieleria varia]